MCRINVPTFKSSIKWTPGDVLRFQRHNPHLMSNRLVREYSCQSPARHTTSTWRGGAPVLTVKPSAPCTHLTEDRDKGPHADARCSANRSRSPATRKAPKSGKERALTKRDEEKSQGKRAYAPTAGRSPSYKHPDPRSIELAKTKIICLV